jgi:acetyl esterase/lipase
MLKRWQKIINEALYQHEGHLLYSTGEEHPLKRYYARVDKKLRYGFFRGRTANMRRSISSILVEKIISNALGKQVITDELAYKKTIQEMLQQVEVPYELNYKRFKVDVKKEVIDGMDYYILNSDNRENRNKIMYFHGGAYLDQPIWPHWKFLNKIASNSKTEIWVPIYPKIPFHNADYAYKSLIELYKIFIESVKDGEIIFMGDSSGGGLVLGMAQQLKDRQVKQPAELIMISPWLDVSMTSPYIKEFEEKDAMLRSKGLRVCGEFWAGDKDAKDPTVSPLYGEIKGLGRMTVFIGTYDILYPDSYNLFKKAESQQITVDFNEKEYMGHVYPLWPIYEAKEVIQKIENIVVGNGGI